MFVFAVVLFYVWILCGSITCLHIATFQNHKALFTFIYTVIKRYYTHSKWQDIKAEPVNSCKRLLCVLPYKQAIKY